jgi:topoisomerase IV subunit A
VRLVITPRSSRVDVEQLMAHLFATTDLERSYRVNMNVIALDGRPRVMGLREMLLEWLQFRRPRCAAVSSGGSARSWRACTSSTACWSPILNLDEVIRIVRTEDEPKAVLMRRFELSDVQAEAILDTKLRHLARLEEMKIRGEQAELSAERDALEKTLASPARLRKLMRAELERDAEQFGDERRTKIVERAAAQAIDETELVASEPVTVVLSTAGWVRSAKGHEIDPRQLSFKTGDGFQAAARGRSTQQAVFLDSTGRAYSLPALGLPGARGQGEPLSGRLDPPDGASFAAVMIGEPADRWLLACDSGHGFIARLEALAARNRAGKAVFNLPEARTCAARLPGTGRGRGRRVRGQQRGTPARLRDRGAAGDGQGPRQPDLRHTGQEGPQRRRTDGGGRGRPRRRQAGALVRRAAHDPVLARPRCLSRRARTARRAAAPRLAQGGPGGGGVTRADSGAGG